MVSCVAAKSKLQDFHSRKPVAVAKFLNIRCDDAQVLSKYGQLPEVNFEGLEQFLTGNIDPPAVLGRLVAPRHLPSRGKAAEMVYSNYVDGTQCECDTGDPPMEIFLSHCIPVVDRVPPQLTGF